LFADRTGLSGEHQESRLEGVLGIVPVAEHAPADAEHQRSVPADQRGKGALFARACEPFEQEPVRQLSRLLRRRKAADVSKNDAR